MTDFEDYMKLVVITIVQADQADHEVLPQQHLDTIVTAA